MKKKYILPKIHVRIFKADRIMIGALEMSDPKFQKNAASKRDMFFDDNNDDYSNQSQYNVWDN